jgi:hypothetical protein
VQQRHPLLGRRELPEFARHDEVLGPTEQPRLRLRNLDHQRGLGRRELGQCFDAVLHLGGLALVDAQVGVGHACEHERERGEIARRRGIQALELRRDAPHGRGVPDLVARARGEAQEAQQGHRSSPRSEL